MGVLRLGQGPPFPRSGGVSKEDRGGAGRGWRAETLTWARRSRPPCPQQPQAGARVVPGPALRPRPPRLPGLPSQREVLSVQGTPFGAPGPGSGQGWLDPGLRIPPAGIRPRTHGTRRRETYKTSRQRDNLRAAFTSFTCPCFNTNDHRGAAGTAWLKAEGRWASRAPGTRQEDSAGAPAPGRHPAAGKGAGQGKQKYLQGYPSGTA